MPDAETCEQILATHELAMGVLRTYRELAESDWARERGAIVEVEDRIGGTVPHPERAMALQRCDDRVRGVPRYRGEDNRAVLQRLLGLTDAEVDALEADGRPGRPPPPLTALSLVLWKFHGAQRYETSTERR